MRVVKKEEFNMRKLTSILIIVFIAFSLNNSWAQMTDQQKEIIEKNRKQFEEQQKQMRTNVPTMRGPVGKYQAFKLDEKQVFILNTMDGKFWLWDAGSNTITQKNQIEETKN